jgi:hypothetical protein
VLKWTAGVVGGIAAVVTAYNQLSTTVDPVIKKYLNPLPSDLVVYVSPDPLTAKSSTSWLTVDSRRDTSIQVSLTIFRLIGPASSLWARKPES